MSEESLFRKLGPSAIGRTLGAIGGGVIGGALGADTPGILAGAAIGGGLGRLGLQALRKKPFTKELLVDEALGTALLSMVPIGMEHGRRVERARIADLMARTRAAKEKHEKAAAEKPTEKKPAKPAKEEKEQPAQSYMPITFDRKIGGGRIEDLDGLRERMAEQALGQESPVTMNERNGESSAGTKLAHGIDQLLRHWKRADDRAAPAPLQTAINDMVDQGVPLNVATRSAWSAYRRDREVLPRQIESKRVGLLSAAKHASHGEAVYSGKALGAAGGMYGMSMAAPAITAALTKALVASGISEPAAQRFAAALATHGGPLLGLAGGWQLGGFGTEALLTKSSARVREIIEKRRGRTGMPQARNAMKPVLDKAAAYKGELAPLKQDLPTTAPRPPVGKRPEPTHSVRQFENSEEADLDAKLALLLGIQ